MTNLSCIIHQSPRKRIINVPISEKGNSDQRTGDDDAIYLAAIECIKANTSTISYAPSKMTEIYRETPAQGGRRACSSSDGRKAAKVTEIYRVLELYRFLEEADEFTRFPRSDLNCQVSQLATDSAKNAQSVERHLVLMGAPLQTLSAQHLIGFALIRWVLPI
jgi:hypothetical protein